VIHIAGTVILGAGIAGISAAYHLQKIDHNAVIYEAKSNWGGLLDNFTVDGFRFDQGVHLSFTKEPYVRSFFDQVSYYSYNPQPYCFSETLWLKHPVQNNLYPLPIQVKVDAIKSFVDRPVFAEPCSYYQWMLTQYGSYLAGKYLARYADKYWATSPKNMTTQWIGNRMYQPTLDEVLHGAMSSDTENVYYAGEMRYPQKGGYRAFIEPMAGNVSIKLNMKAVRINTEKQFVEFENGERVYYDNLISSIPLPELVSIIDEAPILVKNAAAGLNATSCCLVSLGFKNKVVTDKFWFYIYGDRWLPSRAYAPHMKSKHNVPAGCSSLQFEIYYSRHRPFKNSKEQIMENIIMFLEDAGLSSEDILTTTDIRTIPYANVIFEHGMTGKREIVRNYISEKSIYSIGRFGEWDYLWSDQSLLSGSNVSAIIKQKLQG